MNREELAWAAGLFDGEGTVYLHRNRGAGGAWARLTIVQNDPQVLARFRDAVGLGNLLGPYRRNQEGRKVHNPFWSLHAASWRDTQAIAALLWRWLSPVKRAQITRVCRAMKDAYVKGGMSEQT